MKHVVVNVLLSSSVAFLGWISTAVSSSNELNPGYIPIPPSPRTVLAGREGGVASPAAAPHTSFPIPVPASPQATVIASSSGPGYRPTGVFGHPAAGTGDSPDRTASVGPASSGGLPGAISAACTPGSSHHVPEWDQTAQEREGLVRSAGSPGAPAAAPSSNSSYVCYHTGGGLITPASMAAGSSDALPSSASSSDAAATVTESNPTPPAITSAASLAAPSSAPPAGASSGGSPIPASARMALGLLGTPSLTGRRGLPLPPPYLLPTSF